MQLFRMKKAIAWDMLGWFIFALLCLVIALILLHKFSGNSSNLLDKVFGVFG